MTYKIVVPLIVLPLLVGIAQVEFLVFHVAAEVFASVVGVLLFFVAAITLRWVRDGFFFYIGAGYFWVAVADLMHTLTYKGMGILAIGDTANPATQYWIATRLLEALILLTAPALLGRSPNPRLVFTGFGVIFAAIVAGIHGGVLPAAYVEGQGLTPLKVGLEYAIIGLLGLAWLNFHHRRDDLPEGLYRTVTLALALTATAELAFTFYVDVFGLSNLIGHLFKFLSFWLLFLAAEKLLLTAPMQAMAKDTGALNALPDPVVLVEPSGRILHVNQAARAAFGLGARATPDRLHDVGPLHRLHSAACPVCDAVAHGRSLQGLEVFSAERGLWYAIDVRRADVQGAPDGAAVVQMRDITATKALQHQVREEKQRADMALENSHLGIWDWAVPTGYVTFSDQMMRMIGYEPGDWPPSVDSWAELVHPDDLPEVEAALQAHLSGKAPIYDTIHRMRRKDGSYAWIHDIGRVVERAPDGTPLRAIGTHADVTATKELELDLQRSNQDLEQFAYAVSHDLQEPLRMIGGFLGILRRRYRDALSPEAQDFVDRAVDGAERMTAMIRDLLEVSRVHTQGATFEELAIGEAVAAACGNLQVTIAEAGAEITGPPTNGPDALPAVLADRSQVVRLLQNLIGNALKYHRPGEAPRITIDAARQGPMLAVTVADAGPGIPEADRDRVFQPFQRLHPEDAAGTGIGLTLCRRIVDRHGGTIEVQGNPAGGTTMAFTLPLAPTVEPDAAKDQDLMAAESA